MKKRDKFEDMMFRAKVHAAGCLCLGSFGCILGGIAYFRAGAWFANMNIANEFAKGFPSQK